MCVSFIIWLSITGFIIFIILLGINYYMNIGHDTNLFYQYDFPIQDSVKNYLSQVQESAPCFKTVKVYY